MEHNIDEILQAVAENSDGDLLYSVDQLSSASIEISSESTDFTDKNGNVVRTKYNAKTGTFNSTNAFLHPAVLNASSGNDIQVASSGSAIKMPTIKVVKAGEKISIADALTGTVKVIGVYGNSANDTPMTAEAIASATTDGVFTAPNVTGGAVTYLVMYDRNETDGIAIVETADKFPDTVKLTLYCSYIDPCEDGLMPCYVVIPKFMADPNKTINLDRESQELDFNGILNTDYCSGQKVLYYIYYPGNDTVETAVVEEAGE